MLARAVVLVAVIAAVVAVVLAGCTHYCRTCDTGATLEALAKYKGTCEGT
jgi:hypothetical protein